MVVWKVIEILLKLPSVRIRWIRTWHAPRARNRLPLQTVVISLDEVIRGWKAAVRFRLKKRTGFRDIERLNPIRLLGTHPLLLPDQGSIPS